GGRLRGAVRRGHLAGARDPRLRSRGAERRRLRAAHGDGRARGDGRGPAGAARRRHDRLLRRAEGRRGAGLDRRPVGARGARPRPRTAAMTQLTDTAPLKLRWDPGLSLWLALLAFTVLCLALRSMLPWLAAYPPEWTLPIADPIDQFSSAAADFVSPV